LVSDLDEDCFFSGDLIATITIVIGSAVAVAFASHKEKEYSIPDLFRFFEMARFLICTSSPAIFA
jgi:hypothetical protein